MFTDRFPTLQICVVILVQQEKPKFPRSLEAGFSYMWNQRIKKPTFCEQVTDVNDCSLAVKEE